MPRLVRTLSKRLGLLRVGRRRTRDLYDFIESRHIDTVIDVGANAGQFGRSLRAAGYRGRIVSFEPVESAFQALSAMAASDNNWQIHRCALGAAAGEAQIHVSQLSVFSSLRGLTDVATRLDSRLTVDHEETVPVRILDEAASTLSGNILLKIDTQGYERQVLESGMETLRRSLGVLMELPAIHLYRSDWNLHEAIQFMDGNGFVLAQVQAVNYHNQDPAAAVDFDCLFRPRSAIDAPAEPPA